MSDRADCSRLSLKGIHMDSESPWTGNIPIDLVNDILLRLPPKAVVRCMCASKKLYSLVKSAQFIMVYHLNCSKLEDHGVLIVHEGRYSVFSESETSLIKQESGRIPFPVLGTDLYVLGSCRGLVLVRLKVESGWVVLLWNPLLEKFKVIDTITIKGPNSERSSWRCAFALGFHEANNDYRVVRINMISSKYLPEVDVYSLTENNWHPVNGTLPNGNILPTIEFTKKLPAYINGLVHWLATYDLDENVYRDELDLRWFAVEQHEENDRFVILSFDFDYEVFKVIELPTRCRIYDHDSCFLELKELNGKLALFGRYLDEAPYYTFVLMNYPVVESWYGIGCLFEHKKEDVWPVDCAMPLVCTKKENCIFKHPWIVKEDMLMYLNAKEDKVYELEIMSRYLCPVIVDFVGCLVLLDVENQVLDDHSS